MNTPNGIKDQAKYESLIDSITANGWQGAPLVKWGEADLITGSHRYQAAKEAGLTDSEIPMIALEEVFEEAGFDFAELHAEFDSPTYDEIWFSGMLDQLPEEIVEKYGIQF